VSQANSSRIDRIGACASAICAVHCILTGIAFGLLSVAGLAFLREPWVEALFFLTTLALGIIAMRHGLRRHGSWVPSAFFMAGLGIILVKHFLLESEPWGAMTSLAGAALMVTFFVLNSRLPHKSCGCFKNTECPHEMVAAEKTSQTSRGFAENAHS
jgi:hypothetical protein